MAIEDDAVEPLIAAYKRARREIIARLNQLGPGALQLREMHVQLVLAQIDAALRVLEDESKGTLRERCEEAIRTGWAQTLDIVRSLERIHGDEALAERLADIRPIIPAQTVARMANSQNLIIRGVTQRFRSAIAEELAQSVAQGEGIAKATRRLRERMEGETWQIERIARTEINNALNNGHNQAINQVAQSFPEMGLKKQWSAHLDNRTSPICRHLDGDVVGSGENFHALGWSGAYPPAHPNCRSRCNPYSERWGGKRQRTAEEKELDRQAFVASKKKPTPKPTTPPPVAKPKPTPAPLKKTPKPKPTPAPVPVTFGDTVRQELQGGLRDEQHAIAIGRLISAEVEKREPRIGELHQELADLEAKRALLAAEVDRLFKLYKRDPSLISNPKWAADFTKARDAAGQALKDIDARRLELGKLKPAVIRDVLANVRPMGLDPATRPAWAAGSEAKAIGHLEAAMSFLPRTWLAASKNAGSFHAGMQRGKNPRGFYNHGQKVIRIPDGPNVTDERKRSVALHELGHRMEYTVPGVTKLEEQFYRRRTAGEALRWLGPGYARHEQARFDKFLDKYMGKDYGGRAWEILTMGLEAVYYDRPSVVSDPDYAHFILGLLGGA